MKNLPYYAGGMAVVVVAAWLVNAVMPHSLISSLFWIGAAFLVGMFSGMAYEEVRTSRIGAKEPVVRCWGCRTENQGIAYHVCDGQSSNFG